MDEQPPTEPPDSSNKGENSPRGIPSGLTPPLYGLLGLGILYTLYLARGIALPIVLAILISLLLSPLVKKAKNRLHMPRVVSALVLVLMVLAGLVGIGVAVTTPALEWAERAPEGISRLLTGESELKRQIAKVTESAKRVEKSMEELAEGARPAATTVVLRTDSWRDQLMTKARNGIAGLAMALALTYFLLVSGDRLIQNFVRQLPRGQRSRALHIVTDSQKQIARFLTVISINNIVVGVTTGLLSWAAGLPDPAVWGLIAGLVRFVPYLGVIITTTLLTVVSAISLDTLWMMAIAPIGFLALSALVGLFIEPSVHGFRMSINPVVIFVSIFFWGWLWGPVGVLLAVPLMAVIQMVLKQIPRLRPVYNIIAR